MEFWKVSTRKFENFGRKIWNWKNQPMRSRKVSIERFWGIMSLVIQFGKFRSKDSELEESVNELSESFDRKIRNLEPKDSRTTVDISMNGSKVDGRSRPRSNKQIEAYKCNFRKADTIALKLRELDIRVKHLQSLVLRVLGDI